MPGRGDYEERKDARIERLRKRAGAKRSQAASMQSAMRKKADHMAGTPILLVDDLERLRADLYHFDFDLVREDDGEWRVSRAAWSRATRSHFLP